MRLAPSQRSRTQCHEEQQGQAGPSPVPLCFDGQHGISQSTILMRKATDDLGKSHLGLHHSSSAAPLSVSKRDEHPRVVRVVNRVCHSLVLYDGCRSELKVDHRLRISTLQLDGPLPLSDELGHDLLNSPRIDRPRSPALRGPIARSAAIHL